METNILHLSTTLGQFLQLNGATVTVAESCTGGAVGAAITAVPGSSQWFEAGFITYSNNAKHQWLEVGEQLLAQKGAVSAEVVDAMASGALARSGADYAVAVSGIAGPDGGTPEKPVGTVWLGWASRTGFRLQKHYLFGGDREDVRQQSVVHALQGLLVMVQGELE